MNPDTFLQILSAQNINLNDQQITQLDNYFKMLVKTNQNVNLTAITEKEDVYLKHFYDSITLAFYDQELWSENLKIIDIGSGAGFPGVPLKIVFPQLQITLVDTLKKRVNFLDNLIEQLGLSGIQTIHGRAEDLAREATFRETFDRATARAVAKTSVLAEYLLPFVKQGGKALVMKAATAKEELIEAEKALKILGGEIVAEEEFQLPNGDARTIEIINKVKAAPKKYPRQAGMPSKKPLV